MTWDGVKAAIELALRQNDIPTRALALSKSASIKAKQNKNNKRIKHTKFVLDYIEETEDKTLLLKQPMYITTLFSNISLGLARIDELNLHCRVAAEWDPTRAQWHERLYPDCHMVQGDRLQRLPEDSYYVESLRRSGKVEIHFIKERLIITKDSAATELTFWNMFVMFANAQVNSQTDKVKASLDKNWSLGKWQGQAPIGYLNIKTEDNKADVIVDPVRGPIIKKLFEEYATGNHSTNSLYELAKTLGLYSIMKKKKGCYVSKNSIYELLTRPFYYGEMCVKGELMPHVYEPLVSKELFDKVQKLLIQNGNHNRANVKETSKTVYTFRRLIRCKECDCLITPEKKVKKSGREYVYLRCGHSGKVCHQGVVNEKDIIEQLKMEVFNKLTLPLSLQEVLKKQLLKNLNDTSQFNAAFKSRTINKINELKIKEDALLDFYLEGKLPQSTYETKKASIDKEIKELEANAEKYKTIDNDMKKAVEKVISTAVNISNIFDKATPDKQNLLLRLLLTDCKLNGKRLEYKLKAPFDKLIMCQNYQDWPQVAVDNLEEFEMV